MAHHSFHYNNGSTDSSDKNQEPQLVMVLHSRVPMQSSSYQPPPRQLTTANGIGGTTAATQGQVGPRADAISNRTSVPSSGSLFPITNPDMKVNYQYDPVPAAEGYDIPAIPLEVQQHLTYMQPGCAQHPRGTITPKYNGRPMDNTMAILSSELYDDGSASRRPVRRQQEPMIPLFGLVEQPQQKEVAPVRKTNQARQSHDAENSAGERRKKKQKVSSEDEGEDDAAKKARGRPRLDTKDETAADVSFNYFFHFTAFQRSNLGNETLWPLPATK